MSGLRYTEEFKNEAVAQITDRGHSVKRVAEGLGVCTKSIYDWVKRCGSQEPERRIADAGRAENRRLKAGLARVTEERDILKEVRRTRKWSGGSFPRRTRTLPASAGEVRLHRGPSPDLFSATMCRVLTVHPSGFYAWAKSPLTRRAWRSRVLTGLIKQSWLESSCVYGYRKVHHDLLGLGEACAPNTVALLMQRAGLKAQVGYKRRPGHTGDKPSIVATNQLQLDFTVPAPDRVCVTGITPCIWPW